MESKTTVDLDIPKTAAERIAREDAARACECPRCGRMHHRLATLPPIAEDASIKAIVALREPAACFAAVANTIRQSTADVIEDQRRKTDRYGLALMMIREGCEDPRGFAAEMLKNWKCPARPTADPPEDCNWPICGCDPVANKVIEALEESGALKRQPTEEESRAWIEQHYPQW